MKKINLVLFFSLFFSCKEKDSVLIQLEQKEDVVIKKQTSKLYGNLISEQEFVRDSSDKLRANGFYKKYFKNGNMESLSFFAKGILDSISLSYYENGSIRKKNYFSEDGRFFGPQYYYSADKSIDSIDFYYTNNKKWLSLRLDNNEIKSHSGSLLHVVIPEKSPYFDSIPIAIPLMLLFEPAFVEGKKTEVSLKIQHQNMVVFDTVFTEFLPVLNTYMCGIKHKFMHKGIYTFKSKVTISESSGKGNLYSDSGDKKITVY